MSHRKKQTNKQTNVSIRSESVKEYVLTRTTDFLLKKKEKKAVVKPKSTELYSSIWVFAKCIVYCFVNPSDSSSILI